MTEEQINENALEACPEKTESLIKLKGWLARSQGGDWVKDENGTPILVPNNFNGDLSFYFDKPKREKWFWYSKGKEHFQISRPGQDAGCFKNLSWEDEPIEAEILIRKV